MVSTERSASSTRPGALDDSSSSTCSTACSSTTCGPATMLY